MVTYYADFDNLTWLYRLKSSEIESLGKIFLNCIAAIMK
jgi:hypothetical protein